MVPYNLNRKPCNLRSGHALNSFISCFVNIHDNSLIAGSFCQLFSADDFKNSGTAASVICSML